MSAWRFVMSRRVAIAFISAVVLAPAGCRSKAGQAVTTSTGGLTLEAALQPDPPRQEGNALLVTVKDARGKPVEGATVELQYLMPTMGSMAEMRGKGEVSSERQGRYRARFNVPMSGTWTLTVSVQAGSVRAAAEYRLTVGSKGLTPVGGTAGAQETALSAQEFPPAVLTSLWTALDAYEEARHVLASDRLDGLSARAGRMAAALRAAAAGLPGAPAERLRAVMEEGAHTAETMGRASGLEPARAAFGEVSRILMLLANCDSRVADGWHVYSCPMTKTFPKWIQRTEPLENPYMGPATSTCGSAADWSVVAPGTSAEVEAHAASAHAGSRDEVAYYTCSMHTSVRQSGPGTCPICSMNLVPVTRLEAETGVVVVDAQRRQAIGVRTEPVQRRPLVATIRAVGKVAYDQTRLHDVSVKYKGWITTLVADEPGQPVRKGQVLFTLYSPELYAAQEELLSALASQTAARATSAPDRADYLAQAARQRLRLWDLTEAQIDRIVATGQPIQNVPIVSPVSGHLVEKNVVNGAAVEPGMKLFRIAGLDRVWVEADVYESELSLVKVGQPARVGLPYAPHRYFQGRISFIYPYVDPSTRTARVRVELANPDLELKPDMYASVELERDLGLRLAVPEQAVLYTGERRFVFLDLGQGRLRPQQIEVGARAGDLFEVVKGLKEGDVVVTSGNFLVAAESRLKLAMEQWK